MKRDLSLDILRGLMLIIMAADHFGEPVFQHIYEFAGYISAAEGFVFLSGLLVALVYGRYYHAHHWQLEQKIWHRAGVIYFYHLVVLLGVFIFTTLTKIYTGAYWHSFAEAMQANPIPALLSGIVLVYQPSMLDILPMYVVLMLLAPISLRLMQRYKTTGMTIVLATSLLIWVLPHIGIGNLAWLPKALTVQVGAFNWLAWQLIFVSGMVIGFIRLERKAKPWQPKISLMLLSLLVISFLYLQRHGYIHAEGYIVLQWLQTYSHIARDNLGWLRLVNVLAMIYFISGFIALTRDWQWVKPLQKFKQWLAFLGQHSLQVFAYHLVVLYFYIPFRWGAWAITDPQKWFALVLFLVSLTLPAWLHARYQAQQKAKRTQAKAITLMPNISAMPCAAAGA